MFAVIYRAFIKADREVEYRLAWREIATYFVKKRGALGSSLHKSEGGLWLAYSRWPDQATRDASWPQEDEISADLPQNIKEAILTLKGCIDARLPEIAMEVVEDFLTDY